MRNGAPQSYPSHLINPPPATTFHLPPATDIGVGTCLCQRCPRPDTSRVSPTKSHSLVQHPPLIDLIRLHGATAHTPHSSPHVALDNKRHHGVHPATLALLTVGAVGQVDQRTVHCRPDRPTAMRNETRQIHGSFAPTPTYRAPREPKKKHTHTHTHNGMGPLRDELARIIIHGRVHSLPCAESLSDTQKSPRSHPSSLPFLPFSAGSPYFHGQVFLLSLTLGKRIFARVSSQLLGGGESEHARLGVAWPSGTAPSPGEG